MRIVIKNSRTTSVGMLMHATPLSIPIPDLNISEYPLFLWISKNNDLYTAIIVHLHGMPGGPAEMFDYVPQLFVDTNFAVITFNYPGIWEAPGTFSYKNASLCANSIIDFFHKEKKYDQIVLFGESFGGALAVHVTANDPSKVNKVILRSPVLDSDPLIEFLPETYAGLQSMGILRTRNIDELIATTSEFNPKNLLTKTRPVPFWGVIGKNDEILPANAMIEAAKPYANIDLELWPNFPHNEIYPDLWKKYRLKILQFLS